MAKITFQNLTKTGHIPQKFDYTISFGFLLLKFLEFTEHIFSSLTIRQNFSFCLGNRFLDFLSPKLKKSVMQ